MNIKQNKQEKIEPENLVEIEQEIVTSAEKYKASLIEDKPAKKDTLTNEEAERILSLYAEKIKTSKKEAIIGITALVQAGGTNASIPPFTRTVNGNKHELKILRETVEYATDKKGTIRQLAKTMRDIIYKIALTNDWLGPLAKCIQAENPEIKFSPADLVAAAEFHDDNNAPYITEQIRKALRDRAQKIQALKAQKPKQKKGRKKKK